MFCCLEIWFHDYWCFMQLLDCFSFILLFGDSTMDDNLGKKVCLLCPSFFNSDNLFHVYHLICCHLSYKQIFSGSIYRELITPCKSRFLLWIWNLSHSAHLYLHADGSNTAPLLYLTLHSFRKQQAHAHWSK